MTRALATIRKISEINSIPDADAIEVATIDGWNVVIRKGEYAVGDLVVYAEVDSWIPHELAPFLSKGQEPREYNGVKGERLRSIKLRGQISQGLLLPLSVLGEAHEVFSIGDGCVGADVTEQLGIQKWEAPIPAQLAGQTKGNFPSSVPKTDEERIQNLTRQWDHLSAIEYEVTEKMEGSSTTIARIDGEFIVCSRNINLKETEGNTFWYVARKYDVENKLIEHRLDNIAIQGELVGPGVQANYYGLSDHEFYVFKIIDVSTGKVFSHAERTELCKKLGLLHVPVIGIMSLSGMDRAQVLEMADGQSLINTKKLREGLVFKRADGNGDEHFKAVSNKYLLKTGG